MRTLTPEWQRYFTTLRNKGLTLEDIRQTLENEGYDTGFIQNLFLLYGLHPEPMERGEHDEIESYLKSCEEQGYTLAQARTALITAGHKPDDVDIIIEEYKREKSIHELERPSINQRP